MQVWLQIIRYSGLEWSSDSGSFMGVLGRYYRLRAIMRMPGGFSLHIVLIITVKELLSF